MTRLWLILGSLMLASATQATTYVGVDQNGKKIYSDRPIAGGQPIELEPAQTYSAPPPTTGASSNLPQEQRLLMQMDDFKYESCGVTPTNDQTFTNPESVPIEVSVSPGLRPGDVLTLSIDGKVVGTNVLASVLQPAHRGSHTVQVTVKDNFGRVLCSASSTFHVFRPSLNLPRRN